MPKFGSPFTAGPAANASGAAVNRATAVAVRKFAVLAIPMILHSRGRLAGRGLGRSRDSRDQGLIILLAHPRLRRRSRVSNSVLRVCPGARRAESTSFFLARDPARQLAVLLGQFE